MINATEGYARSNCHYTNLRPERQTHPHIPSWTEDVLKKTAGQVRFLLGGKGSPALFLKSLLLTLPVRFRFAPTA